MIRLFKVSIPSSAVALFISETILLFCCYLLAAWLVLDVPLVTFLFEQGGYWHIFYVMAIVMVGLYFNDLYADYRVRSRIRLLQQFCLVLGVSFLLQALLSYTDWGSLLPKGAMLYGSLLVLIVLPLWRIFFTSLLLKSGGQKVLFLGSSPAVREIVTLLAHRPEVGLTPIGYLGVESPVELSGTAHLGSFDDLDQVIAERRPARIVIGTDRLQSLPVEHLLELRLAGLQIEEASDTYEVIFRRVSTRDLAPSQIIFSNEMSPRANNLVVHTVYSFVLGVIGILVTLPIMAVVAILVRFTVPGPILNRRLCAGLNGAPFRVFKFRSMELNVEADHASAGSAKAGSRITFVGKWLRKLRLDELPQLFNVVRGEMAIVGPRPERVEFVSALEQNIPYYRQRLLVKPGITGWAQINATESGKIENTVEKLEYDRYYIKNLSLSLDAHIIIHTLKVTLLGR